MTGVLLVTKAASMSASLLLLPVFIIRFVICLPTPNCIGSSCISSSVSCIDGSCNNNASATPTNLPSSVCADGNCDGNIVSLPASYPCFGPNCKKAYYNNYQSVQQSSPCSGVNCLSLYPALSPCIGSDCALSAYGTQLVSLSNKSTVREIC